MRVDLCSMCGRTVEKGMCVDLCSVCGRTVCSVCDPFLWLTEKGQAVICLAVVGVRRPKSNPNRSQIGSEPSLKIHLKKAIVFFDVKNNVFEEKRSKKIRSNKHRCSIFAAIYSTLCHLYLKAFKAA